MVKVTGSDIGKAGKYAQMYAKLGHKNSNLPPQEFKKAADELVMKQQSERGTFYILSSDTDKFGRQLSDFASTSLASEQKATAQSYIKGNSRIKILNHEVLRETEDVNLQEEVSNFNASNNGPKKFEYIESANNSVEKSLEAHDDNDLLVKNLYHVQDAINGKKKVDGVFVDFADRFPLKILNKVDLHKINFKNLRLMHEEFRGKNNLNDVNTGIILTEKLGQFADKGVQVYLDGPVQKVNAGRFSYMALSRFFTKKPENIHAVGNQNTKEAVLKNPKASELVTGWSNEARSFEPVITTVKDSKTGQDRNVLLYYRKKGNEHGGRIWPSAFSEAQSIKIANKFDGLTPEQVQEKIKTLNNGRERWIPKTIDGEKGFISRRYYLESPEADNSERFYLDSFKEEDYIDEDINRVWVKETTYTPAAKKGYYNGQTEEYSIDFNIIDGKLSIINQIKKAKGSKIYDAGLSAVKNK